jgi:GNAT superfamily N-acetyltransferase
MIIIKLYKGSAIRPFISDIARLRISVFREFPYLYDGNYEYEQQYLSKFSQNPNALIAVAFNSEKVIGAFTGLPMRDEDPSILAAIPLENQSSSFYLSEVVLLKEYRKRGIGIHLFKTFEDFILQLNEYNRIYFASIIRPENHPLKPTDYKSADLLWAQNGYIKTATTCFLSWKEINEAEPSQKELAIWEKVLF